MLVWLLRRIGQVLPTLFILSVLIFGLQQLMPGDPALILAGEERGDPQVLAQIRAELRLDRPIYEQYLYWIGNVLTGDFGFSWRIRMPVSELILDKLPVTAQLAAMSFIIAVLIGVPAGILSAVKRDRPADWAANGIALFGISTPNFWLGIMMIVLQCGIGLAAAIGLCAADRGFLAIYRHHHHAGFRARYRCCLGAHAPYACGDADRAFTGLCSHRTRQRAA